MTQLVLGALCSAALLAACFPKWALWYLAPLALAPYVAVAFHRPERWRWWQVLASAYLLGAGWYCASLWWIGYVSVAGMLALCLFIALLLAGALTLAWWLRLKRTPLWLALPLVWMALEAVMTYLMTGFPWMLLGYAWSARTGLIQVADIGGVYLVSFLIVLLNVAVAEAAWCAAARAFTWSCAVPAGLALALAAADVAYGRAALAGADREAPRATLQIACVQANVASDVKHDSTRDVDVLRQYRFLSLDAAQHTNDVLIWPETAMPGYYLERGLSFRVVNDVLQRTHTPMLAGLARYELSSAGTVYFNSAGVIATNGALTSFYDKMHLVVFGEYVPLERYLPFLQKLTPIAGSFSAGTRPALLPLSTRAGATVACGPLICFEDVFSCVARAMARAGADLLVNLTNDGWYHSSPGAYQHAALSVFRAIETRLPLVRSTNSGVTMLADRCGRITAVLAERGSATDISGVLYAAVPVYAPRRTFYVRHGDWFLMLCALATAALAVRALVVR